MDEKSLREVLVKLIAYAKDDHKYAYMLGNELAALRDALDELSGGKFKPIWEKHSAKMKAKTKQVEEEIDADYDELMRTAMSGS